MPANLIDSVCEVLPPELVAAAADLVGEREDLVRRSITAFVPVAMATFSGHAHQPGQLARFHDDVTGSRVDPLWIAPGTLAVIRQRLPSALQAGRLAGAALFGEHLEQAARALSASTDVRASSAAVLIDLSFALVLSQLKRVAGEADLDAHQLGRILALQYTALASRTDPSLVEGFGYPSVAAWLSARGADTATCHPMAPAALARRRSRQQLSSVPEQLALVVLLVSLGVMVVGAITPFNGSLHRIDAARALARPVPSPHGDARHHRRDSRALSGEHEGTPDAGEARRPPPLKGLPHRVHRSCLT